MDTQCLLDSRKVQMPSFEIGIVLAVVLNEITGQSINDDGTCIE